MRLSISKLGEVSWLTALRHKHLLVTYFVTKQTNNRLIFGIFMAQPSRNVARMLNLNTNRDNINSRVSVLVNSEGAGLLYFCKFIWNLKHWYAIDRIDKVGLSNKAKANGVEMKSKEINSLKIKIKATNSLIGGFKRQVQQYKNQP